MKSMIALVETPWASGVLRGSGWAARAGRAENRTSAKRIERVGFMGSMVTDFLRGVGTARGAGVSPAFSSKIAGETPRHAQECAALGIRYNPRHAAHRVLDLRSDPDDVV